MLTSISLRPHHLVCLQSFQGKGYDTAFVHHTSEVLSFLEKNSDDKRVVIVDGCDELCRCCTNNHGGICSDEDEVRRYDDSYLNVLKLSINRVLSWTEIKQYIMNELSISDFSKICRMCCWYGICRKSFVK